MNTLLSIYALCVVVLFVKMLAISCYQGFYRISRLTFKNPEDAGLVGRPPSAEELPQVARAAQAWANDLENIPLFFVLGALCLVFNPPLMLTAGLMLLFTVARLLHTLCFLARWQPWRTIAYAVAIVCLLAMAALVSMGALRHF
ncbi:MAPEG family protein [Pseudomonas sp. NPDC087612]|uniref:MAPEG family protein n=1 Tax=unclassified Pseudomonas TaxID=196821 RepID=UPI0005EB4463|nr:MULTISPECIES: MAPEG family protein [unclassified Pseudomonas]KJK18922.1 glutathione metabolism protein [Pseudomonas sp. 2(2015)]QVM98707.1 MAPEG family protein [Pseudomonas sp. SORT22]UVM53968.1 MAPEG family protein [Pseudomonas sp. B21-012]